MCRYLYYVCSIMVPWYWLSISTFPFCLYVSSMCCLVAAPCQVTAWGETKLGVNASQARAKCCMCILFCMYVHWMGTLCTEGGKVGFEPRTLGYQTLSFANCTRHLSPSQTCNAYPIKAKQAHTCTYMQYLYVHAHKIKYLQHMHIHVIQLNALACKKI